MIYSSEFLYHVQNGDLPGYSLIQKFGEAPLIQTATPGYIWNYTTQASYTFSTDTAIDSISSSSDSDTITVTIEGLEFTTWEFVSQTVVITGQTRKALDTDLIRVFRVYNACTTDLVGNLYVYENTTLSAGVPVDTTKVRAYVAADEQQTLMAIYTIPAGKTGYMIELTGSLSKKVAAVGIFEMKAREFGKIFRVQEKFSIESTGNSFVRRDMRFRRYPEKTDIITLADVSVNDTGITSTFDILLVDN